MLSIKATISGIKYTHIIVKTLRKFQLEDFGSAIVKTAFQLQFSPNTIFTISRWVSPKRTRSYPYVNVFNTLPYNDGKRVTIIPVLKDEGVLGDRDFIQWDTISLMSLLGVYVILTYYTSAVKSNKNKLTNQQFDLEYLVAKLRELTSYKSDALHWNMQESKCIRNLATCALKSYQKISIQTGVVLHDESGITRRIHMFYDDLEHFKEMSRNDARAAQLRESQTIQPKESIDPGLKATITIENYLKGLYYLTVDEAYIKDGILYLTEAKHSKSSSLPSKNDVIDGLMKMIIFCNLEKVIWDKREYQVKPVLRLTGDKSHRDRKKSEVFFCQLEEEASINGFTLSYK